VYRKSSLEHLISKERTKEYMFNMGYGKGFTINEEISGVSSTDHDLY
jgi:hypothetical protein